MSSPKKFTKEIEVVEYLHELPSSQVLENSSLIYTFNNTPKTKELMNQFKDNYFNTGLIISKAYFIMPSGFGCSSLT